jgi:hypothetical protein
MQAYGTTSGQAWIGLWLAQSTWSWAGGEAYNASIQFSRHLGFLLEVLSQTYCSILKNILEECGLDTESPPEVVAYGAICRHASSALSKLPIKWSPSALQLVRVCAVKLGSRGTIDRPMHFNVLGYRVLVCTVLQHRPWRDPSKRWVCVCTFPRSNSCHSCQDMLAWYGEGWTGTGLFCWQDM